jgi:hypothetical protein
LRGCKQYVSEKIFFLAGIFLIILGMANAMAEEVNVDNGMLVQRHRELVNRFCLF